VASTFIKWTVNCNYCCAIVHYKKCQPRKVGGTKHRASPPLQKVGGTCPPVHPRIYAHAVYDTLVIPFLYSTDSKNMILQYLNRFFAEVTEATNVKHWWHMLTQAFTLYSLLSQSLQTLHDISVSAVFRCPVQAPGHNLLDSSVDFGTIYIAC